jgi:hypothetical protein
MQPDPHLIAQLLTTVALLGATIEYREVVRRREARRTEAAIRSEAAHSGLRGLVRVFAAQD